VVVVFRLGCSVVFLVCWVGFVCLLCCLLFYCGGRHGFVFVLGVVVGVGDWSYVLL